MLQGIETLRQLQWERHTYDTPMTECTVDDPVRQISIPYLHYGFSLLFIEASDDKRGI
jgi:hypothetical protein